MTSVTKTGVAKENVIDLGEVDSSEETIVVDDGEEAEEQAVQDADKSDADSTDDDVQEIELNDEATAQTVLASTPDRQSNSVASVEAGDVTLYYTVFEEAWTAAKNADTPATVTLLSDVKLESTWLTVSSGNNITLNSEKKADGSEYTISVTSDKYGVVYVDGGTVMINGGTINGGYNGVLVGGGTATLTGGTFTGKWASVYI